MASEPAGEKPLFQKLGVKPGMAIAALRFSGVDFLNGEPYDPHIESGKQYDLIFIRIDEFPHLRDLHALKWSLAERGGLWVIYPKGQKHITQQQVMFAGNTHSFTDNKVVRFSETHTGLRFVRRLK